MYPRRYPFLFLSPLSSTNSICRTDSQCLTLIVSVCTVAIMTIVKPALKMQCVIQSATMKPA